VLAADNSAVACTERTSELECIQILQARWQPGLRIFLERVYAEKEKSKEKEEQAQASNEPKSNSHDKGGLNYRIVERRWP
jgi:hypothetical protein